MLMFDQVPEEANLTVLPLERESNRIKLDEFTSQPSAQHPYHGINN